MKKLKLILVGLIIFCLFSCSVTKNQKQGTVNLENFHIKTEFTFYKSLIIIPSTINSESKNFLFDTGAQLTVVQRDSLSGKIITVTGGSGKKLKMGSEVVKSISIGNLKFKNTYALNQDLVELKERIPNFGGILGQSIIQKANWLIDFPNKKLEISNNELTDNTFTTIEIDRKDGSPFTFISINGKKYKAIIDLGATRSLSIPKDSKLAKDILKIYNFKDIEKETYTIGAGIINTKWKVGNLPMVKLGNIENNDVETLIKETTNIRIGSGFFKTFLLYIDNTNSNYKIKKVN